MRVKPMSRNRPQWVGDCGVIRIQTQLPIIAVLTLSSTDESHRGTAPRLVESPDRHHLAARQLGQPPGRSLLGSPILARWQSVLGSSSSLGCAQAADLEALGK